MDFKPWLGKFSTFTLTIILSLTLFSLPAVAFVPNDLSKLQDTGNCYQCDLSDADLSGEQLYNADLRGANLSKTTLNGVNLERAELNGANFLDAQGEDAIFKRAILVEADLSAADFPKANMQGANFENATLTGTELCEAFLFEAIMPDRTTYLEGVTDLSKYDVDLNCDEAHSTANSDKPDDSVLLSSVRSAQVQDTDTINFHNVRLGITPTGWSNSDDLKIDTNPPIPYQQILSEIALSGFSGTQGAPKFPGKEELKKELDLRNLTISEPWVGTYFTLGDEGKKESERIFDEQIEFMKDFDSKIIVVAELGGAVHQQPIDPIKNEPVFTPAQNQDLYNGLISLAKKADAQGYKLVYHPHVGTGVATIDHINNLMTATHQESQEPQLYLLLDTGHVYYTTYGHESLSEDDIQAKITQLTDKYKDRIKHVHMKNIRHAKLVESVQAGRSFLNSIREGVFTVPGDDGAIDFDEILGVLASANYEGWLIVEAEQDPNTTMEEYGKTPLDYALMAREYLREQTGL